jgi:hypothetical protein
MEERNEFDELDFDEGEEDSSEKEWVKRFKEN